jgi:GH35 family endo-1,4-beta-xylanase
MRRFLTVTTIALAGSLAAAALVAPAAQAVQPVKKEKSSLTNTVVDDSLFGMHVFNAEDGVWPTVKIGALRLWDNETTWSSIEVAPNQFNWAKLDGAVANAEKNGVKDILMVLAGTPSWATDDPASGGAAGVLPGAAGMPRNLADWDDWVTQVVTRYKGRITAYQPWNEANLTTFSTGSPQQMAELTKRTYDIVKRIDPAATVVAPSMGTRLGSKGSALSKKFTKLAG